MRIRSLKELLKGLNYQILSGEENIEISEIVYDSRKVSEGCLFICIVGANFDGHKFATDVVKAGARALVVSKDVDLEELAGVEGREVTVIRVEDTRYAMAFMAAAYFDHPAGKLKTIGVTGTKGKTTTTYMVKNILEHAGHRVGLVGTIEIIIGEEHIPAVNTTPESFLLQEYFSRMVEAGIDTVVMEVSSQALMLHRTQGFIFDLGILTNLEPDHIGPNEHKDMEDYMHCKGLLFKQCRVGLVNGDDEHTETVIKDHSCKIIRFGLGEGNDIRALDLDLLHRPGQLGVSFKVVETGKTESLPVEVPTPGRFSVYNGLTAVAICRQFDVPSETIVEGLANIKVKGRIEMVKVSNDFTLMIDYAHNAMSLRSLLETLKEYDHNRIVCLFGCGGNRSRDRRFEMGEVSGKMADLTIITSDNPRNEEPMAIIEDIITGISRTSGQYVSIPDRKEAIRYAIKNGEPGDIVILAGKGHEDYQEINGVKYHMDERELIAQVLVEENIVV